MRQRVAIIRDHSYSITSYRLNRAAARDYNSIIADLQAASRQYNIDTLADVWEIGNWGPFGKPYRCVFRAVNVHALEPLREDMYEARGHCTPLFDTVGAAIEQIKNASEELNVLRVITDGQDNASSKWAKTIEREMRALQATDRWTFTFRVPCGYKAALVSLGVPEHNVLEWEQTEAGMRAATSYDTVSTMSFYETAHTHGVASPQFKAKTRAYFADISNVPPAELERAGMRDITGEVRIATNDIHMPLDAKGRDYMRIDEFCERKFGNFRMSSAFYQLNKPERIQDHKLFCILDTTTGKVYEGDAGARKVLGIPTTGDIRLSPRKTGIYHVHPQSKSTNRYVPYGSQVLVWENAR